MGDVVGEGMKASLKSKSKVLGIPQKPRIHSIPLYHCELFCGHKRPMSTDSKRGKVPILLCLSLRVTQGGRITLE